MNVLFFCTANSSRSLLATCDDACPYVPGKRCVNWQLPDPKHEPVERVREIRDDIAARVNGLAAEFDAMSERSAV